MQPSMVLGQPRAAATVVPTIQYIYPMMSRRGSSKLAHERMQQAARDAGASGGAPSGWQPGAQPAQSPMLLSDGASRAACRVEPPPRQRQTSSQVASPYTGLLSVPDRDHAEYTALRQAMWMAAHAEAAAAAAATDHPDGQQPVLMPSAEQLGEESCATPPPPAPPFPQQQEAPPPPPRPLMAIALGLRSIEGSRIEWNGEGVPTPGAAVSMQREEAVAYLEKHDIATHMQEALNAALVAKPKNPFLMMGRQLMATPAATPVV